VILDFFTEDLRPEFGVMLFWPFEKTYYISPVILFDKVTRSANSHDFFISLFSKHNIIGALKEFFIMIIAGVFLSFLKKIFTLIKKVGIKSDQ
jgi:hypothetical protein